jgi:hypothetical protein|tara:strand:+ start:6644 stop:6838 length:195 start_codon:yes stop_codon:yes gene_type:complete
LLLRFSDDQFTTSFITTIGCAKESSALAKRVNDVDGAVTDPENRLSMREGLILRLKRWKSMGSG